MDKTTDASSAATGAKPFAPFLLFASRLPKAASSSAVCVSPGAGAAATGQEEEEEEERGAGASMETPKGGVLGQHSRAAAQVKQKPDDNARARALA